MDVLYTADATSEIACSIANRARILNDEKDTSLIKILNAQVQSLRDQTVLLQQAIDEYAK